MDGKRTIWNILAWLFGAMLLVIGLVNAFWGNDPFFGIFILGVSLIYFPPVNAFYKKITNFSIPLIIKIIAGLFVLWAALGVGELFDKILLMITYFQCLS